MEGDARTKLFHANATIKHRNNLIAQLQKTMEKQPTAMQKKKSFSGMLSKKDWDILILPLWLLISAISWKVTQSCPGLKNLSPQKKLMQW